MADILPLENSLDSFNYWWSKTLIIATISKKWFLESIIGQLPPVLTRSIASLFFSVDDSLLAPQRHIFEVIGIQHLLVVSGYHVAILARGLTSLTKQLSPRVQLVFLICLLLIYSLWVGLTPPVVRASLGFVLRFFLAKIAFRQVSVIRLSFTVLSFMLVINPFLLFSISFQLTAVASICLAFIPYITSKITFKLLELYLVNLAMVLVLGPLILWYFGEFTLVGIILAPVAMLIFEQLFSLLWWSLLLAVATTFSGGLLIWLTGGMEWLVQFLWNLLEILSKWSANWPVLKFELSFETLVIWYVSILTLGAWIFRWRTARGIR